MVEIEVVQKPATIESIIVEDRENRKRLVIQPSKVKENSIVLYLSGIENSKVQLTTDEAFKLIDRVAQLSHQIRKAFVEANL